MHEINEKRERSPRFSFFSQGSCTTGDLYRTRTRLPVLLQLFFSEFFRHSVLPAWQTCLQNTNVHCPPRSSLVRRVSPPSV